MALQVVCRRAKSRRVVPQIAYADVARRTQHCSESTSSVIVIADPPLRHAFADSAHAALCCEPNRHLISRQPVPFARQRCPPNQFCFFVPAFGRRARSRRIALSFCFLVLSDSLFVRRAPPANTLPLGRYVRRVMLALGDT